MNESRHTSENCQQPFASGLSLFIMMYRCIDVQFEYKLKIATEKSFSGLHNIPHNSAQTTWLSQKQEPLVVHPFRISALSYETHNRSTRAMELHSVHVLYRHAGTGHERID